MSPSDGNAYLPQTLARQVQLRGVALASFPARAAAFLIDGLIVALLILAPGIVSSLLTHSPGTRVTLVLDFDALVSIAVVLLYFGLATYFGNGATIGKRLLGIRVVSLIHRRLPLWHSIERALGYAASSLELGFGFLQYFTHPNRQTVHDRIAETIVVNDRARSAPPGGAAR
jgi:uncharacterized RDD family membrane protein YckC